MTDLLMWGFAVLFMVGFVIGPTIEVIWGIITAIKETINDSNRSS